MDQYTVNTKQWVESRNRTTTDDGIFFGHQNIYGFKSPYVEDGIVLRYVIVCNVVKALSHIKFDSLLDVGGAEGYMAALIKKLFNVKVRSCDLSEEACQRAREMFGIEADGVDGAKLPYADESFDVVISSETLEHISQYQSAFNEIMRVAKKAVVITVPHDTPEMIAENIRRKIPHAHINLFTLESFKDMVPSGTRIKAWGLYSMLLRLPYRLVEGREIDASTRPFYLRPFAWGLNLAIKVLGKVMNEGAYKFFYGMDHFLANKLRTHRQMVFIIAKDPSCVNWDADPKIDVDAVLDFKIPLYRMTRHKDSLTVPEKSYKFGTTQLPSKGA